MKTPASKISYLQNKLKIHFGGYLSSKKLVRQQDGLSKSLIYDSMSKLFFFPNGMVPMDFHNKETLIMSSHVRPKQSKMM